MKTPAVELALNRWPYGLELQSSAKGLLLRPRRKARAGWPKSDYLAAIRQITNEFDAKEWQW